MTRDEALTLIDLLHEAHQPSKASWGERVLEYGRAERSQVPLRIAHALAELYAEPALDTAKELMVRRLEERLFPDLARALGEPEEKIRGRLHHERKIFEGEAEFIADEPEGPLAITTPDVVAPAGWVTLHSFRVFGEALVVGGLPEDPEQSLTLKAPNGYWHVFEVPPARGLRALFGTPRPSLVVLHESALPRATTSFASARALGSTDGRLIVVVDGAARRDVRVRARHELHGVTGRSYVVMSGSSEHEWRAARADDDLVLLTTPLDID